MTALKLLLNETYNDIVILHAIDAEREAHNAGNTELAEVLALLIEKMEYIEKLEEKCLIM